VQDNVLRLDISVDDPQRMDLVHGFTDLPHNEGDPCLRERLRLLELMIELPSSSNFQYNVDVDCIVEAAIHLDDVGMIQEHLYLDLTCELIGNFLLMQQLLLDYL
jgi:hypothetical protein